MPEEHAEELIAHTAESRRYAEQLVAHAALGPGRAPTRRGRRGGRALRARRERRAAMIAPGISRALMAGTRGPHPSGSIDTASTDSTLRR